MIQTSLLPLMLALMTLVARPGTPPPVASPNDNRQPAGSLTDGVLTLELRAQMGAWHPEGDSGRALRVAAFSNGSGPLSIPGPLIRVPEGTRIAATVHNDLEQAMVVHGLCSRGRGACPPTEIPPGQARRIDFESGSAGTYHYWATTTGTPLPFRAVADDTQLSGAMIVDPAAGSSEPDRVFVITDWTSVTRDQLREIAAQDDPGAAFLKLRPDFLFLMNGLAWPHTERLIYRLEEPVRWRVVNLSSQIHTMHLHGFYFEVDSLGDGMREERFTTGQKPSVVTQLMQPGATMTMTWRPEREGNWLFHCHIMTHVSPMLHVDGTPKGTNGHDHHDASSGMTGMVIGVTVEPRAADEGIRPQRARSPRQMTLVMRSEPRRFGDAPAFGFLLADGSSPPTDPVPVPGPVLVLKRNEPVDITLVNKLPEGTAVHWHGMELESYYDGVHGWSGTGLRVTPLIEPGESFVVRFTPPRTGTFMYHTHLHDQRQLTSGLYGAMLVIDENETFDEATDHVFIIGRGGPQTGAPVVLNGEERPLVAWRAGARHRVRLINITPDDIVAVSLQSGDGPVTWRPLTKDGSPVPPARSQTSAARQIIGVGETYDFEYEAPSRRQSLWLEVRSSGGRWLAQGRVAIK